jgi:hypothetical protein
MEKARENDRRVGCLQDRHMTTLDAALFTPAPSFRIIVQDLFYFLFFSQASSHYSSQYKFGVFQLPWKTSDALEN